MVTYLTPIRLIEYKKKNPYWLYRCICGKEKIIFQGSVNSGVTKSCGCYGKKFRSIFTTKHGESSTKTITREYKIWSGMKQRCYNPKNNRYAYYAGRNIKVCDRWLHSYKNFLHDMGRRPSSRHSLDRIDNNKDYCPENCRWATMKQQQSNKKNNVYFLIKNKKLTLSEVAKKFNIHAGTVHYHAKIKKDISKFLGVRVILLNP